MKKLFAWILGLAIMFTCTACATQSPAAETNAEDLKKAQFESGRTAYRKITEASELCVDMMDSIYGAWYFAIYESDDYTSDYAMYDAFESETGLNHNDVMDAFESLGLDYDDSYCLEDFSFAVGVAKEIFTNTGKYDEVQNKLDEAKDALKQMTDEYEDYTNYSNLKKYYSEVSSYFEFAESPSGSFSQLKETIDNYETNIRTYKNDLGFIFD